MAPTERERVLRAFPLLSGAEWRLTSPATERYNCVAWATGDDEKWWWPEEPYFWPEGAPFESSVSAFVIVFGLVGYESCESSDLEPGWLKVAIFAKEFGPTHIARQLPSGAWSSKLGSYVDIEHPLETLVGSLYGNVAQVLRWRA